jgi:large subunit ribosomal protein L28
MSAVCQICGKKPALGNRITTRGKAKYLGGVGTKVTGIARRKFKPNLQRVRAVVQGTPRTIRACTQCIRSGRVTKPIKQRPFHLPRS